MREAGRRDSGLVMFLHIDSSAYGIHWLIRCTYTKISSMLSRWHWTTELWKFPWASFISVHSFFLARAVLSFIYGPLHLLCPSFLLLLMHFLLSTFSVSMTLCNLSSATGYFCTVQIMCGLFFFSSFCVCVSLCLLLLICWCPLYLWNHRSLCNKVVGNRGVKIE